VEERVQSALDGLKRRAHSGACRSPLRAVIGAGGTRHTPRPKSALRRTPTEQALGIARRRLPFSNYELPCAVKVGVGHMMERCRGCVELDEGVL